MYIKYERTDGGGDDKHGLVHDLPVKVCLPAKTDTRDPPLRLLDGTKRVGGLERPPASLDPPPPVITESSIGTVPGRRGVDPLAYARVPANTALPPATGQFQVALAD